MTTDPYTTGEEICREVLRTAERTGLPEENRGSWYCPCATERHERIVRFLAEEIEADRIYDLGAGDLRLSAALAEDYEVVAYETNELLANRAYEKHGNPDIQLRTQDYYAHWASMNHRNAVFACIGRTNELPGEPQNGVGVEGVDNLNVVFGSTND